MHHSAQFDTHHSSNKGGTHMSLVSDCLGACFRAGTHMWGINFEAQLTSNNLAKDGVLVVQVVSALVQDEKLGAVGVFAGIGHTEYAPPRVQQTGIQFILEGWAIYGLAPCACACGIPTLHAQQWSGASLLGQIYSGCHRNTHAALQAAAACSLGQEQPSDTHSASMMQSHVLQCQHKLWAKDLGRDPPCESSQGVEPVAAT